MKDGYHVNCAVSSNFLLDKGRVAENLQKECFYAPGLKGPPGASSNRIVRLSVCPFVCLFVCLSVIPSRLQTKCNNLSLADDKVTKLGL